MAVVFKTFPVYMKVFDADSGSCSNPEAAYFAAARALVVLMTRSRLKSLTDIESGSSASVIVKAAAKMVY